jgi:hypothetical protein
MRALRSERPKLHIHQIVVAEGMDGADERLLDTGWLARLLAMPEPPTPPSRQKRFSAAPGGPLPDLFCDEIMPKTTSWPPLHKPWPCQAPTPPDGSSSPLPGSTPPVAAVSPLPSSRDPTRVVGMPVTVESGSRHARPCRMSELDKLKERMEKLERTLRALSDRIDASSRKRPTQQVNQPGSGGTINVSGGAVEGNAHFSFGEGSTMNAYLLDRFIDECWPDTPS